MGRKRSKKWKNGFVHNPHDYSPQSENNPRQTTSWLQTMKDFYSENEHLGTENRTTEFKSGPGFIKYGFRENVAKYVCGFVNSQENGKLLIGVNDNGNVEGYDCTQQLEDRLRREIDEAVKDITPSVFPKDYSVGFVPVHNEQLNRKGDLKVIEIMVQGSTIEMKDQLYCNRQGVFMRRDGSIQELKANEVQEWIRRRYQGELDKVRKNEGNLQSELQTKQSELRQTEEKLQEKNYELDKKEFALQRQKSTMNHMSDKMREMQDDLNHMKQGVQNEAQGGNTEVLESLAEMKQILKEQETTKKGSKVCSIS